MLLFSLVIPPAWAQDGIDAHGAFPAASDGDVRDPLLLTRPGRMNRGESYGVAIGEAIGSPLVLVTETSGVEERVPALDDVFGVQLMGGYAVHDRVRVDALLPLFLASRSLDQAQGARPGDVRLSAMVALVRPPDHAAPTQAVGVGVVPWVSLPTGDAAAFLGQPGVAGGAQLAATLEAGPLVATGLIGPRFAPASDLLNLTGSDGLDLGASAGWVADPRTAVHLEGKLRSPFVANAVPWRGVPAEVVATVRHRRPSGVALLAGLGTSATPAIGSPAWRVVVGGGWGQVDEPYLDPDGDGVIDDKCPHEPETFNGWMDEDGCPDRLADLHVSVRYKTTEYPEADLVVSNGTQQQRFDFGPVRILSRPPGEAWTAESSFTCMFGRAEATLSEGDNRIVVQLEPVLDAQVLFTIVDDRDQPIDGSTLTWVAGPEGCAPGGLTYLAYGKADVMIGEGNHEIAATAKGYETRLVKLAAVSKGSQEVKIQLAKSRLELQKDQIRILEKVHFETNSHVIKPISYELLSEVAATIVAHPEFGRVEVAGHADERGSSTFNLALSDRRAAAVRDYLIKEGVNEDFLVIRGYGEDKPLVDGSGEEAWSENRRVQFHILGPEDYNDEGGR